MEDPATSFNQIPPPSRFQQMSLELLSSIFKTLSPKERAVLSRTCKNWRMVIVGTKSFWRELLVPQSESIEVAIQILELFSKYSQNSLKTVVINTQVSAEKLEVSCEVFEVSFNASLESDSKPIP